jgi:predicted transposase YbfD/YdcC
MPVPDTLTKLEDWKGLKTIGVAIRVSKQDTKETSDVRYYISSTKVGVKRFAERVRGHWGIENTLHWCLDVTFREDDSRLRNRHAADNLAWLKRFAISLLSKLTRKALPCDVAWQVGIPTTLHKSLVFQSVSVRLP